VSASRLNIVVALPCEARFFLDKYRLSRLDNHSTYSIYSNVERSMHLIVSGVGKVKSAAALGYLHALSNAGTHTCYLNAGIAGAEKADIGQCFTAYKIIDAMSGKVFYPLPILVGTLPGSTVVTVEKPTAQYPDDKLVDMEAAGFHQAALGFVTQEQVQTLKIISDNSTSSLRQVSSAQVTALFQNNALAIQQIVDYLLDLSTQEYLHIMPPAYYLDFIGRFHFTQYQRHQLHELLRRWQINFPTENALTACTAAKTSARILIALDNQLAGVMLCK
jgi:adenosylhomocysteine nucleosidase